MSVCRKTMSMGVALWLTVAAVAGSDVRAEGAAKAADWPQWGGPQRDFAAPASKSRGARWRWPNHGPAVLWSRDLGPGYAGIVGDERRLYTMTRDGDQEIVVALSADRGQEQWRFAYEAPVPKSNVDTSYGAGPNGTPLVANGGVYTLGFTGIVQCLNASNGKPRWSVDLQRDYGINMPYFGIATSPVRYGDMVIFLAGGAFAFDLNSGQLRWKNTDFAASYASPILVEQRGKTQLVAGVAGEVVGLDPQDGRLLWRVEHANQHRTILSAPVAGDNGELLVSAYFLGSIGLTREPESDVFETRWSTREFQLSHSNAIGSGNLVFGFQDSTLKAVDITDGTVVWQHKGLTRGNLLRVGKHALLLDERGGLSLLQLSNEGAEVLGSTSLLEGRSWTAPTVIGGRLYARNLETMVAVDLTRPAGERRERLGAASVAADKLPRELIDTFLAAKRDLTEAYYVSDVAKLAHSRETFEQWSRHPQLGHLAHYYMGFSFWQQALVSLGTADALPLLDSAVDALKEAVRIERRFADAHALLARLYPMYYRLAPRRGQVIGVLGDEHLAAAMELDAANPRTIAIHGLDLFYSPVVHGGDRQAGLGRLEDALDKFGAAPQENSGLEPDWGHAVTWAWYAQALTQMAEPRADAAQQAAHRAVELAPNFAFAQSLLDSE